MAGSIARMAWGRMIRLSVRFGLDLVAQGQDFAIRYGELADSTLRLKRLANSRRVVCASPAYLRNKGRPQHPDDLAGHECILMRFGQTIDRDWPFLVDGK